ncbi:hypothetical protein MKX57_10905 [Lysinibacillus sp. FSL M8-0216]|uniref:hypothetical protein n=1 Tax=Lysinibacillus sp. FSL M8-0216 TaxID=2921619 RepID=UPI00315A0217
MTNIIKFKKRTKSKHELYSNALDRVCKSIKPNMNKDEVTNTAIRMAYYSIMIVNTCKPYEASYKELHKYFDIAQMAKGALSILTYKELQQGFPIEKEYDGEKFGMMDYFYTVDELKGFDSDMRIGDKINEILWEYYNKKIMKLNSKLAVIMSQINRMEGKKGISEQVFEDMGIDTYTMKSDGELVRNKRKPNLRLITPS